MLLLLRSNECQLTKYLELWLGSGGVLGRVDNVDGKDGGYS